MLVCEQKKLKDHKHKAKSPAEREQLLITSRYSGFIVRWQVKLSGTKISAFVSNAVAIKMPPVHELKITSAIVWRTMSLTPSISLEYDEIREKYLNKSENTHAKTISIKYWDRLIWIIDTVMSEVQKLKL